MKNAFLSSVALILVTYLYTRAKSNLYVDSEICFVLSLFVSN